MHPGFERRLRPIASLVLVFFSWFCIEPWNYALAAHPSPSNLPDSPGQSVTDIFQEDLREIKENIHSIVEGEQFQERLAKSLVVFQAAVQEENQVLRSVQRGMKEFLQTLQ